MQTNNTKATMYRTRTGYIIRRSRPQTEDDFDDIQKARDLFASSSASSSSTRTNPASSPTQSVVPANYSLENPHSGQEKNAVKRKGGKSDKAEEPGRRGLDDYGRRRGSDAKRHSNHRNSKWDSRSDHTPSPSSVPPAGGGASRQGETYRPQRGQSGRAHEDEHSHRAERKHAGVSRAEHHVCAQENPEYNKHSPFTPEPPKHGSRRVPADRVDQAKQHSQGTGRAPADRVDPTKQHSQGTGRAPADRVDPTRKYSSRQTTSHSSENAAQRKTTLYIRIHDVIDDIVALGEVLTSRVSREGVELTPTEAGITRDDRFTYCSLTCDSKSKARKLKTLLMKDKRSTPALDCSFVDFQQEAGDFDHSQPALQKKKAMSQESLKGPVELEMNAVPEDAVYKHSQSVDEVERGTDRAKQKLGDADAITDCQQEPGDLDQRQSSLLKKQAVAKESLKRKVEFEISSMSDDVLLKHKQKVDEVERKIDKAKQKLGDVNTRRETRAEIEALENKLEELDKQTTEFVSAVAGFRNELVLLFEHDDYQRDVGPLRKRVGVECARLDKALPMYARRQDVVRLVQQHPVSILLAETGSGKSTQVVQYLLEAGMADEGTIVCTQPRKVAAVTLATHVAQELATNVGKEVGYKVGSRRKTSPSTKIVYMTDHALLNECLTDPDLKAFSCVVVDEAHERSLYTDLLLSMVKRCLARRPDLRVVITSATIDPQVFVTYFGCCPILKVSGRAFPVDVIWQDSASEENEFEKYEEAALDKVVEIHRKEPPGDVLVFLTSASEIQKCCEALQRRLKDRADFACLPLHGQLQAEEQQKVFQPLERGKRKIVFATNCAETSITIDGIRYVVDTGVAKEMRYNAKKSVNTLSVTAISRSSAEQRKGRAGRTAAGTCYRLYSQRSYRAMDAISLPEILKTHLGHALLKLAELGVTPDMYDFVQSPGQDAIEAALRTLRQLGALHDDVITETGRWIARLPFDPKLGLMTLRGRDDGLLYDVIVLASLASTGSGLFYRGSSDQDRKKLDKTKVKFSHNGGDVLTALEVYKAWEAVDERQRNKWCMANSINAKAIRGVKDSVKDVVQLLRKEVNVEVIQRFSDAQETPDKLRKLIFQCNADNLCHYLGRERAGYFAAQAGRQVHFHPSSAMRSLGSYPQWVVYDQLLQTSRDFITGITPVDDAWLEELGREQFGFDLEQVREKKLVNVFTQPAGSHAFFAMVGPRYSKLRQYEERLASLDSSVVVIEAIREVGELRVFSTGSADSLAALTQEIRDAVDGSAKEMEQEVRELTVGSEDSGLRVVVGQGGQLTDILMPHETRKIFVTRPADDATEESIREKFREFGEICYVHQFPGGRNWGFVVFRTPAQAVLAAEVSQGDEDNVGQLEHRRPAKQHADFKAKLFWCRRPCNGIGFVELSPAYMPRCLQLGFFDVGNSRVSIKVSNKRPEDGLYLRGLPAEATEDLIKRSLLYELVRRENAEGIINNVTVVREKIGKTSKNDLKRLENELKQKFERRLRTSKVEVSVNAPRGEESTRFAGEARFSDPIEGVAACRALKNRLHLNGVLVEVEPVISATLRVQRRVYNACKKELDKVIKRKLKEMEVEVTMKEQGADNYVLSLRANDPSDIVQARVFLNDVINGDVLDCNHAPALRHLMTSAGRKMLREAEKEVSAYVSVDDRKWTVSIHGSSEACTKARLLIDDYLDKVLTGMVEEVALRGDDRPPGLLKALLLNFGDDLDTLRNDTGLNAIAVDYRWHKLKLTGRPESLEKAKRVVEELDGTLRAACALNAAEDGDSIDCVACFCSIDKDDLYRLEACAHPYCKDCIKHQVSVAIKGRNLPVLCCQEDCGLPLAWRDFNTLSRLGQLKVADLASSALAAYVLANRDKACFCVTPNCPMVYRVTSEERAEVFRCPECQVRVCTACHAQAHDGLTCAMLRSSKMETSGLENWVQRDPTNRKLCPGCRSPIEKNGGCNRMNCEACGTIFCWLCRRRFRRENDCYTHLVEAHGGVFDVNELLYDADY